MSEEFRKHPVDFSDCYMNISDHYGIECCFKMRKSLHSSHLTHKSSLALVVSSHTQSRIQAIRQKFDPQYERWPPHFNLLYPFYDSIELEGSEDEEKSVIGDILSCLSQFEPFECSLSEMEAFEKNNVVFLKPDRQAEARMRAIFDSLKRLFEDSANSKWKANLTPHMTIAQPIDKRKTPKGWAKSSMDKIKQEHTCDMYASFLVDSVCWITRGEHTPFEVKQVFPLGKYYPTTICGLNLNEFSQENILKFLYDKNMISSVEVHTKIGDFQRRIFNEIANSLQDQKGVPVSEKDLSLQRYLKDYSFYLS